MKEIFFCGEHILLHASGALFWPEYQMLIVADLHLEKGSFYASRGFFLPPYDTKKTLDCLLQVISTLDAKKLLMLGDCFHDAGGYDRLGKAEQDLFGKLLNLKPLWVRGNHDGDFVPHGFEGYDDYRMGTLLFRHQARPDVEAEISGHYHPKAKVLYRGEELSRPCFIEDGRKLILPAFGAYTGGLSINDPAISSLFTQKAKVYLLGKERIFEVNEEFWR